MQFGEPPGALFVSISLGALEPTAHSDAMQESLHRLQIRPSKRVVRLEADSSS